MQHVEDWTTVAAGNNPTAIIKELANTYHLLALDANKRPTTIVEKDIRETLAAKIQIDFDRTVDATLTREIEDMFDAERFEDAFCDKVKKFFDTLTGEKAQPRKRVEREYYVYPDNRILLYIHRQQKIMDSMGEAAVIYSLKDRERQEIGDGPLYMIYAAPKFSTDVVVYAEDVLTNVFLIDMVALVILQERILSQKSSDIKKKRKNIPAMFEQATGLLDARNAVQVFLEQPD